ncbi:unnamed protein product [Rotaria sp. Silwood2]|nr:unnamed protein product [Rotaria sp. Silwood2]
MGSGYAVPEFGLAYVRDIRFFRQDTDEWRLADMMVSACYCLPSRELYNNPKTSTEWPEKTMAKFRAFMAAAVANTRGNGLNTYRLLGPLALVLLEMMLKTSSMPFVMYFI